MLHSLVLFLIQIDFSTSFLVRRAFLPASYPGLDISSRRGSETIPSVLAASSWFDNFVPDFLRHRDGDFERLKDSDKAYGPGPLLLVYNFPSTMDDAEIDDMIADAAPSVQRMGYALCRVTTESPLLDLPLSEALQGATGKQGMGDTSATERAEGSIPVLFFSGFTNPDMMAVYNIMGREVYLELSVSPACAKAVPNAMDKTLRQVLTEIVGDHAEAIEDSTSGTRTDETRPL